MIITTEQTKLLMSAGVSEIRQHEGVILYDPCVSDIQKIKNTIDKLTANKSKTTNGDLLRFYSLRINQFRNLINQLEK